MYKVVLVGDPGVGKTNLLAHFIAPDDQKGSGDGAAAAFSSNRKPTVGVEFATKVIVHPESGMRIKAQIWDTAGQERYRAITSSHYRRASGALLVYDASNRKTFASATSMWLKELREAAAEDSPLFACTCLTGNKIDLDPQVSDAEHAAAVHDLSLSLSARSSAKTGAGVDAAFESLILAVHEFETKAKRGTSPPVAAQQSVKLMAGAPAEKKKGCCK